MLKDIPLGYSSVGGNTSTNLAVKSVSTADDDAHRCISTGPVTSNCCLRYGVWNVRTSSRSLRTTLPVQPKKSGRGR